MNDIISIIVPIYNAETNIPSLLDNVLAQTYANWQLILVDDGSSDKSYQICSQFATGDKRIIAISQPNGGPSAARNKGLSLATGQWVTFVDADDKLLDCFLESMIHQANKTPDIDIVFAGYTVVETSQTTIFTYNTKVYNGFDEVRSALGDTSILHRCSPWGKMFRKTIIDDNHICFNEKLSHSEDRLFVYDYLIHTNAIATTSVVGYIYDSAQPTSLKNKILPVEKVFLRQRCLSQAAYRLFSHFRFDDNQLKPIVTNLLNIFSNGIQGIFQAMGNETETLPTQRRFYNDFLDQTLYYKARNAGIQIPQSEALKLVLENKLAKLNRRLQIINYKVKLSQLANKLLRKAVSAQSFPLSTIFLN